jgi:hypothetical protein
LFTGLVCFGIENRLCNFLHNRSGELFRFYRLLFARQWDRWPVVSQSLVRCHLLDSIPSRRSLSLLRFLCQHRLDLGRERRTLRTGQVPPVQVLAHHEHHQRRRRGVSELLCS